ncbi:hypothetical protein V8E54_007119 [Elaphomyces granulatus]
MARHSKIWLHDAVPGHSLYVPDSGHRGLPSGPDAQEDTTVPEPQVAHTLPVRSTENPVTAQDTMPTLQPLHEGEEHSVTVEEQISRTSCSEDVSDPELLLAHRQLQELRCQRKKAEIQALIEREKRLIAQAQKDAVSATLIESNQGPVVPQPLQEAIAATPTGRIKAHKVQPPALQDAVSATPTRSIQANEVQVI